MRSQVYYSITVRSFILRCGRRDWLVSTQDLYNKVIAFYFKLFLELENRGEALSALNARQALRRLETLTIPGRDKQPVKYPLPWQRIPLYFRRAAVNWAVTAAKSSLTRNAGQVGEAPQKAALRDEAEEKIFHCAVTFYKGTYRELKENSVELKVWTGEKWTWMHCRLSGNSFPKDGELLSPSLILREKSASLNIPVREPVPDGRKARERIQQHSKVCSVQFTNEDTLAAAVILDTLGKQTGARFFRGGAEYIHKCGQVLSRIADSEKKMGIGRLTKGLSSGNATAQAGMDLDAGEENPEKEKTTKAQPYNRRYWMKLKHLSEFYSHRCSRQLIEFCLEQKAEILILPEYSREYTRYVMCSAGNWSPVHLGGRIRSQLFYKAWREGIVVLEVNASGCGKACSVCGAPVRKKGNEYQCGNGHRGNRYLNTARNLGLKCLESFRIMEENNLDKGNREGSGGIGTGRK